MFCFLEPILAPFLDHAYGVEPDIAGIVFVLIGVAYSIACTIVLFLYSFISRRTLMHVSGILMAASLFLCAPSRIFGLPASLPITATGCTMTGFFCVGLVIMITELIETSKKETG